jgi:hypothetical protein
MSNPQQLATDKLFRETMHVAAGDTVAVGTACDSWTYVQHVGKDRVRRGWIEPDEHPAMASPTFSPRFNLIQDQLKPLQANFKDECLSLFLMVPVQLEA